MTSSATQRRPADPGQSSPAPAYRIVGLRLRLSSGLCVGLDSVLWMLSFLYYAATTFRDILPADSGEFQLIASSWGIAHPPGYPLYTMATAIWSHSVPLGSLPFRVNLFSAVLAATTLVLCARCARAWADSLGLRRWISVVSGVATALALSTAGTFWAQATTANIRMPAALFTAWGYLAMSTYQAAGNSERQQSRALLSLALATGLGIGHHPSLAFVAMGWLLALAVVSPQLLTAPRRWWRQALALIASWATPQLYLPLRGGMQNVALAPQSINTWRGFWNHVLARDFGGDMFAFATLRDLVLRLPLLPTLFRVQFEAWMLLGIMAGWLLLLWRERRIAIALGVPWTAMSLVTITYRAPQTIEYLMPSYIPMALALGMAAGLFLESVARQLPRVPLAARATATLLLLALILRLPGRIVDFAELAANPHTRDYVEPLLRDAADDGAILADWRWATPLWVLQQTESLSPSAQVIYVSPEEDVPYEDVWMKRANEQTGLRLYSTHYYAWDSWTFAPVGGGFRLYRRPLTDLPESLGFSRVHEKLGPIDLLGYRWKGEPRPGATLELQIAWRAAGTQDPTLSLATRMRSDVGAPLSSADLALSDTARDGEVRFARLTHQVPIDACVKTLHATVGVYTISAGGFQDLGTTALPSLMAQCIPTSLPTDHPVLGVAWPSGPILRGVDYDVDDQGGVVAYLHWCGPGAPLRVQSGAQVAVVPRLGLAECQSTSVPLDSLTSPDLTYVGVDGTPSRLIGQPLPRPRPGDRYVPYGDAFVLVEDSARTYATGPAKGTTLLGLTWLTARPQYVDYAMSVRFLGEAGTWLGMHDMQPGLGAVPTLKWVVRDLQIYDPHPVVDLGTDPMQFSLVIYDRFRLTPLRSRYGEMITRQLR